MLATGLIPIAAQHLHPSERGPLSTPVAPLALGRYLTHTQCSACHGRHLSGEADVDSPDLRFAIKHYSLAAFESFFRTGIGQLGHGTSTMTPLIRRRFHLLTKAEVRAIYLYLNHSTAES
jgi:mono/diheme cytochrome c family protein